MLSFLTLQLWELIMKMVACIFSWEIKTRCRSKSNSLLTWYKSQRSLYAKMVKCLVVCHKLSIYVPMKDLLYKIKLKFEVEQHKYFETTDIKDVDREYLIRLFGNFTRKTRTLRTVWKHLKAKFFAPMEYQYLTYFVLCQRFVCF